MGDFVQRTEEYAPNPEKAEHIFLTVCTKEAFAQGHLKAGEHDYSETLEAFLMATARAWQGAQVALLPEQFRNLENLYEFAGDLGHIAKADERAKSLPLTASRRSVALELRKRAIARIQLEESARTQAAQQPQQQPQQQQPNPYGQ